MRFVKGFMGASIVAVMFFLFVSMGASTPDITSLLTISMIGALATAGIAAVFEKPSWDWVNYLIAGAIGYGGVMFIVFAFIGMALAAAFHGSVPITAILMLAAITCFVGAGTGAAYRFIAGPKSE